MWTTGFFAGFCILPFLDKFHRLKKQRPSSFSHSLLFEGKAKDSTSFCGKNMRLVACIPGVKPWTWWPCLTSVCLLSWLYTWVWSKPSLVLIYSSQVLRLLGNWRPREHIRSDSGSPSVVPTAWPTENFKEMLIWGPAQSHTGSAISDLGSKSSRWFWRTQQSTRTSGSDQNHS